MKPLSSLTPSQLYQARAKADAESTAVTDAMIAAGRGYEKAWDTLAKAKEANADALTLRFAASGARCSKIRAEEERRMTYHGSLKRIRPSGGDVIDESRAGIGDDE